LQRLRERMRRLKLKRKMVEMKKERKKVVKNKVEKVEANESYSRAAKIQYMVFF
jgi:predicted RNA-binding protein with PUA domain